VCVCVWYDGRGLSKEPRERGFLLYALFFLCFFPLGWGFKEWDQSSTYRPGLPCACGENACVLLWTHTYTHSTYERRGKVTTKNLNPFRGGGGIPRLFYRIGREGRDEWGGRGFIFRKEWKQNLWRTSRKQDRVWEKQNPPDTKPIHYSSVRKMKRSGCEVNLYLESGLLFGH